VCGYSPGTVINLTLNGVSVGQIVVGNNPPSTCTTQTTSGAIGVIGPLGRALSRAGPLAQTTDSGADGSFTVPADTSPGSYLVCAEAPGMDTPCATLNVASSASVLGTTFSRGGAPLVSASNGNSFLAFSGLGLIRMLLLAGVLIASGLFLVRRGLVDRL